MLIYILILILLMILCLIFNKYITTHMSSLLYTAELLRKVINRGQVIVLGFGFNRHGLDLCRDDDGSVLFFQVTFPN